MHERAIAAITGALLVIATTSVAAQDETQPAAGGPADEAAQLAAFTPPPRLSDRALGVHTVDCLPGYASVAGGVEGEDFSCGVLTVPQDWDQPDDRNLDLGFSVVHATGDEPANGALMFLAGGPGGSGVLSAPTDGYQALRDERDIVFMDIRGVGVSQRLGWEECLVLALQNDAPAADIAALREAAIDPFGESLAARPFAELDFATLNPICAEQFSAEGLELDEFSTANNARDVAELITALGYESFDIHSTSYGTRLAMTLMDDLPDYPEPPQLRSVVLDSAFPPSAYLVRTLVRSDHDFMLQLIDECQADAACATAYPDLRERLAALLAALEAEPLTADGQTVTLDDVVEQLTEVTNTRAGSFPKMIAELEAGVIDTYLALRDGTVGTAPAEAATAAAPDTTDPVEAFIADASALLEVDAAIEFAVLANFVLAQQPDPLPVLRAQIEEGLPGETGMQLLELLDAVSAEAVEASPFVAELRATAALGADPAAQQARTSRSILGTLPAPLYSTIHCQEDILHERIEDARNSYDDLWFPQLTDLDESRAMASRCQGWPVEPAPIEVKDPVQSVVPTLVLQGAYDMSTPIYMGRRAARELENSTYVLVPQQGHGTWISAGSCVGRIAAAFVEDPGAPLDTSCLEGRRPQWALPGAGES